MGRQEVDKSLGFGFNKRKFPKKSLEKGGQGERTATGEIPGGGNKNSPFGKGSVRRTGEILKEYGACEKERSKLGARCHKIGWAGQCWVVFLKKEDWRRGGVRQKGKKGGG